MSFVIDTDTCSAHLKGHPKVNKYFLQYTGNLYISVVTLGELYTWTLRKNAPRKRLRDLLALVNDVHVEEVNADIARKFGELQADLYDRGLPGPEMDLLIAATAMFHGFTLVTHNLSDYANIVGLKVIDWMA